MPDLFLIFIFPNRRVNISVHFGNDLSDAIEVLDEGCFTTPASLSELDKIWAEYNLAQEKIQTCYNEVGQEFFCLMVLSVEHKETQSFAKAEELQIP
jgi:hypothetical protein